MIYWRVSPLSISRIFFVNTTKDDGRNGYILLPIRQMRDRQSSGGNFFSKLFLQVIILQHLTF